MKKINEKIVVNTKTREEYDELMKALEKEGIRWATGDLPTEYNGYDVFKTETCICFKWGLIVYNVLERYKDKGYKIIDVNEFKIKYLNKIKAIDLLNMTANKEYDKLPKKIKIFSEIYELKENGYYNSKGNILIQSYHFGQDNELMQELEIIDEKILDEKEKEYLSHVIRPFRNKIKTITKQCQWGDKTSHLEYLGFQLVDEIFSLPSFETGTMYKNMEPDKRYSLEELGL